MESITIKVEEELSKEIDKAMKPDYSTKTEFIREAIRDKIKEIRREKAIDELKKYFGKAKITTSSKEERDIREEVGKKFAKSFGINLD
ncbi:MAG: ribbon-helix-helix domain-containing protein [Nanoarchaeota archaeon]